MSISFFLVMGTAVINGLGQYVNIYHVCRGDMLQAGTIAGFKGTVIAVSDICMLPLFAWLGEKYDKRTAGHLLNYWLMTPAHPYLQIIPGVFESCALGAVWMFLPSMKADVADWNEQFTHRRREGSINAFYSWFIKVALTASMGLGGVILHLSGFNREFSQQPDHVLNRMLMLYLLLPVVIWGVAIASVWLYPLFAMQPFVFAAALRPRSTRDLCSAKRVRAISRSSVSSGTNFVLPPLENLP